MTTTTTTTDTYKCNKKYTCSNGCGYQSDGIQLFKRCSKCKLTQYCTKECHWKDGGHKHECFTPEQNRRRVLLADQATACVDEASVLLMSYRCSQEMDCKHGILVCLGQQQQQDQEEGDNEEDGTAPQWMFMKDIWQEYKPPLAPGLHVDHVPPMLLAPERNRPINFVESASPRTNELCMNFGDNDFSASV